MHNRAAKDPEMLGVRHRRIMWPWHAGMGEGVFPCSDNNILNTYSEANPETRGGGVTE